MSRIIRRFVLIPLLALIITNSSLAESHQLDRKTCFFSPDDEICRIILPNSTLELFHNHFVEILLYMVEFGFNEGKL
tara:strand:- start:286 stop:516 length:231 start_codon:yes stop_codon:yes gene_type:complete